MITEDYVSYEVAKLLKEKGFDESTSMVYTSYGDLCKLNRYDSIRNSNYNDITKNYFEYTAPTHQMAMKWLREEYGISIEISALKCHHWVYTIYKLLEVRVVEVWNDGTYVSYESATNDALKYCLENLNNLK